MAKRTVVEAISFRKRDPLGIENLSRENMEVFQIKLKTSSAKSVSPGFDSRLPPFGKVKMGLYFITGNKGKVKTAKSVFPDLRQVDIELPEIQELNSKQIIEEKLREASKNSNEKLICDDASLEIKCLNGFPGPLIKWFLKALKPQGIYEIVKDKDKKAICRITIGYADGNNILFFEEIMNGEIVSPRGDNGFGFDCLFKPDGYDKTLAEMSFKEKSSISIRTKALLKLKQYLDGRER